MKRITPTHENINSPEHFDKHFDGKLGIADMARLENLSRHFTGGKYIDVGCGDSIMPALLAERYPGSIISALDYAPRLVKYLAERFPKVIYYCKDVYDLPFGGYDHIVAGELIEHLEDPQKFVDLMINELNPGGMLAVSTPLEERHGELGGKAHLWSWTEKSVQELLQTTHSEIIEVSGHKIILAWRKK